MSDSMQTNLKPMSTIRIPDVVVVVHANFLDFIYPARTAKGGSRRSGRQSRYSMSPELSRQESDLSTLQLSTKNYQLSTLLKI